VRLDVGPSHVVPLPCSAAVGLGPGCGPGLPAGLAATPKPAGKGARFGVRVRAREPRIACDGERVPRRRKSRSRIICMRPLRSVKDCGPYSAPNPSANAGPVTDRKSRLGSALHPQVLYGFGDAAGLSQTAPVVGPPHLTCPGSSAVSSTTSAHGPKREQRAWVLRLDACPDPAPHDRD
jgi:hypothetical protein